MFHGSVSEDNGVGRISCQHVLGTLAYTSISQHLFAHNCRPIRETKIKPKITTETFPITPIPPQHLPSHPTVFLWKCLQQNLEGRPPIGQFVQDLSSDQRCFSTEIWDDLKNTRTSYGTPSPPKKKQASLDPETGQSQPNHREEGMTWRAFSWEIIWDTKRVKRIYGKIIGPRHLAQPPGHSVLLKGVGTHKWEPCKIYT